MNDMSGQKALKAIETLTSGKDWMRVLAQYRQPSMRRSLFELTVTAAGFFGCWALAWASISISYLLTGVLCLLGGGFLVRLFTIQHDCGHGSFFASRKVNDWVGRVIGVLTLTPYTLWRRTHAIHHNGSGNLGKAASCISHSSGCSQWVSSNWCCT